MKSSLHSLPPSVQRLVEGRPVMSRDQLMALGKQVLGMLTVRARYVSIEHKMYGATRMTNGDVMMADNGDYLTIKVDNGSVGRQVVVETNQLSDETLRYLAHQFNTVEHDWNWNVDDDVMAKMPDVQDEFVPTQLWHDATIRAMREARTSVLPRVLGIVAKDGLRAAGFMGFVAKSQAVLTPDNISAFSEETDCELTITARTPDGRASGWGGQAARDWSWIDPDAVAEHAVDICKRSIGTQALEPGRRTVILTAAAAAQIMRYLAREFSALETVEGRNTPFSSLTRPGGARYGERVFDARITMNSDPADPDGGYCPYFFSGFANAPTTWVQNGVLKELAWQPYRAVGFGRSRYADDPNSIRISGGTTTIDEMIAKCDEGIFVNRLSGVELLDLKTGMMSGVTRDGCFLVKHGKVDRPVKNFRFLDSPFFMLNKIIALGVPKRAAYGYTPPGTLEPFVGREWPRPPIILPPMMIQDFNFSGLADAV